MKDSLTRVLRSSYIAKVEGADRKLDVLEFVELCQVINIDPSEMIQHLKNQL